MSNLWNQRASGLSEEMKRSSVCRPSQHLVKLNWIVQLLTLKVLMGNEMKNSLLFAKVGLVQITVENWP